MYSTAQADWATGHTLGESYFSAGMKSVYSTAPSNWANNLKRENAGSCLPSGITTQWGRFRPSFELRLEITFLGTIPVSLCASLNVSYLGLELKLFEVKILHLYLTICLVLKYVNEIFDCFCLVTNSCVICFQWIYLLVLMLFYFMFTYS